MTGSFDVGVERMLVLVVMKGLVGSRSLWFWPRVKGFGKVVVLQAVN